MLTGSYTRHEDSIYIETLCNQLDEGVPMGEDLLSILTGVNRVIKDSIPGAQFPSFRCQLTGNIYFSDIPAMRYS